MQVPWRGATVFIGNGTWQRTHAQTQPPSPKFFPSLNVCLFQLSFFCTRCPVLMAVPRSCRAYFAFFNLSSALAATAETYYRFRASRIRSDTVIPLLTCVALTRSLALARVTKFTDGKKVTTPLNAALVACGKGY
ncbi:hypothetical protein TRVL_02997 [Trypanosoma vivax]|nr:hypothetical protein TRVL_02997 [Trypanosoma vivax]